MTGREAECAVLESIFADDTGRAIATARRMLTPDRFVSTDYREVFKAVLRVADRGEPVEDQHGSQDHGSRSGQCNSR